MRTRHRNLFFASASALSLLLLAGSFGSANPGSTVVSGAPTPRALVQRLTDLIDECDYAKQTLRKVCNDIEELLRAHPKVSIDVSARVINLSPTAIEVEVIASFLTTNGDEWTRIRQEVLLGLLEKVEAAGTSLMPGAQSIEIVRTVSQPTT